MAAEVRIFENGGTSYQSPSLDGYHATGTITVHVIGATSRSDAKAAAIAAYPTHPDDATLPVIGTTPTLDSFQTCTDQRWTVHVRYGRKSSPKTGIYAKGFSGYEYSAADKHEYVVSQRFYDTDIDTVIAGNTIGTFGPNGEPYSSHIASVSETRSTGDVVDITVRYRFPNDQYTAKSRVKVGKKWFPLLPKEDLRAKLTSVALNTFTQVDLVAKANNFKLPLVAIPTREIEVFWQSASSSAAVFDSHIGKINTDAYTIAGTTYAIGTLRYDGAEEIDFGAGVSGRYKTVLKFTAVPFKEAWFEILIAQEPTPADPTKPWSYMISNPYSSGSSQSAFPTPPTFIP